LKGIKVIACREWLKKGGCISATTAGDNVHRPTGRTGTDLYGNCEQAWRAKRASEWG
jgi:hypothetical protein